MRTRIKRAGAEYGLELNRYEQESLVRRDGGKAAAWLVAQNRKAIRRQGRMVFTIPRGEKLPPWFKVALATLGARGKSWSLEVQGDEQGMRYVVRWLRWGILRRPEDHHAASAHGTVFAPMGPARKGPVFEA